VTDPPPGPDVNALWDAAFDLLTRDPAVTPQQRSYLRRLEPVALIDGTVLFAVPSLPTKDYIESHSRDSLTRAISAVDPQGGALSYAITVDPGRERPGPTPTMTAPPPAEPPPPPTVAEPTLPPFQFNPRYTFENFVVGESNRYAHAAAVAVAETPGTAYNPLFIYGGSGLGKTHLLHAIGHYAQTLQPGIRVLYCTSEDFTNDFVLSIQEGRARSFQRRYRDVDILLIDDIQFLQQKEQTITEFFHTFNHLHNANKQIVVTSDVPPRDLGGFEERLVSRFQSGYSIDVHTPDLETRIAILRTKVAIEGNDTSEDTIDYIASHVTTNIRELEGALIRVTAYANLNGRPINRKLAEIVLRDFISTEATHVSAETIISRTASYFNVTQDEITGPSRSRTIANARQIAMFLCRELTDLSLPKLAQLFRRDHTTVLYGEQKIRKLMAEKHTIYNQVTELTTLIRRTAS
jgi:chromosomal replication initiator protein